MEQDSIQEWIEYHRSIGFEHFFIYGNDDDYCTLAEVLAPYISTKVVTFTHCAELGAQIKMYVHFLQWHAHRCEWICLLDQDEYVRLAGFNDSVAELTNRAGKSFDSIQLNWLNYGTSGFKERPAGSVLRQYTRRSQSLDVHTKHITRAQVFAGTLTGPFWHSLPSTQARTCSALGEPESFWDLIADGGNNKSRYVEYVSRRSEELLGQGCIAHFHLKADSDFERRVLRGIAGQFYGQVMYKKLGDDPALRRQFIDRSNFVEDLYLANYWDGYIRSLLLGHPPWPHADTAQPAS